MWGHNAIVLALLAAVILLLANTSAFSRKPSPPPYTVDYEIRHYLAKDIEAENIEGVAPASDVGRAFASPALTLLVTSYNQAGSEVILSSSFPNQPLKSVLGHIFLGLWGATDRLIRGFVRSPDAEEDAFAVVYPSSPRGMAMVLGRRETLVSSGCQTSHGGAKVIGHEVILNYPVTRVQQPESAGRQMVTLWMAPELSCFALRATIHAKQPDGAWKRIIERRALKVTVNR
jgi:hypothetical protein